MAKRRLKLTGFARFLIVMMFLVPIAYLGAAYYNGQDGIQNIKDLLGIEKKKPATEQVEVKRNVTPNVPSDSESTEIKTNVAPNASIDSRRLEQLEKRMNEVERENARLREQVRQLQNQVQQLQ